MTRQPSLVGAAALLAAALLAAALLAACSQPPPHVDQTPVEITGCDASAPATSREQADAGVAAVSGPRWLKGNTHTHTGLSGDSHTDPSDVERWYTSHGYDFVVFTDHNIVNPYVASGSLLVLPGVELTHNPGRCTPAPVEPRGHCRIHVNALAVGERPAGKIEWSDDAVLDRVAKYQLAFDAATKLRGLIQVNHPNWHWGVDGPMLAELAKRGATLVEIANQAFVPWNIGRHGKRHPHASMEEIWDRALTLGAKVWGVASDDAHNYYDVSHQRELRHGFGYPPGGGFVMVWAQKTPESIRDALARGHFYSSTGALLDRAEVARGELTIEASSKSFPPYEIVFIGAGGAELARKVGVSTARFELQKASGGYVRAKVTNKYGQHAWTQPIWVR